MMIPLYGTGLSLRVSIAFVIAAFKPSTVLSGRARAHVLGDFRQPAR